MVGRKLFAEKAGRDHHPVGAPESRRDERPKAATHGVADQQSAGKDRHGRSHAATTATFVRQ